MTVYSKLTYLQILEIINSLKLRRKLYYGNKNNSSMRPSTACECYCVPIDKWEIEFNDWLAFNIDDSFSYQDIYMFVSGKPWFFRTKYDFDTLKQLLGISEYKFQAKRFYGNKLQNRILENKLNKKYLYNELSKIDWLSRNWPIQFLAISTYKNTSYCHYSVSSNIPPIDDYFTWDEVKNLLIKTI